MFPSKKKKSSRLARLGDQPLHPKYKKRRRGTFLYPKTPPPPSFKKERTRRLAVSCSPKPFDRVLLSFLVFQFTPTSKCSIIDVFAFHWCAFFIFWCLKLGEHAYICEAVSICLGACFLELRIWMKQWGMPHCPHPLAICVQTCAHQVLGEMPQWWMNMILQNWGDGALFYM